MPLGLRADRAVEVLDDHGPDARRRWSIGSGYRISHRLVLTAAHCVSAGRVIVRATGWERNAAILLRGDPDLGFDIALLDIDDDVPLDGGPAPVAVIDRTTAQRLDNCWAIGFPEFKERPNRTTGRVSLRDSAHVEGFIPLGAGLASGHLDFQIFAPPRPLPSTRLAASPWQGMSGAVVFHRDETVGDCVVGVIAEHHVPAGDACLAIVPVGAVEQLPNAEDWRRLLPLEPGSRLVLPRRDRARLGLPRDEPAPPHQPTRIDWGDAPSAELFVGRVEQIATLRGWIEDERCRLIVVAGMGGIGKTSLVARLTADFAEDFDYVFWRSLYNAQPPSDVLAECLDHISAGQLTALRGDIDECLDLLRTRLRQRRCLIVLDNFESVLRPGGYGGYLSGYEGYAELLAVAAEPSHDGKLVLTTREQPRPARKPLSSTATRVLHLAGLDDAAGEQLLAASGVARRNDDLTDLIRHFAGNPLTLKLVSDTIVRLYEGVATKFLQEDVISFGDVHRLLANQFTRLPPAEQTIMYWLAVRREPATLDDLHEMIVPSATKGELLTLVEGLARRSMIVTAGAGRFTSQPVILEYAAQRLIEVCFREAVDRAPHVMRTHALVQATASGFVRDAQRRLLLAPLARKLSDHVGERSLPEHFDELLAQLRTDASDNAWYAPANVLHLLMHLGIDARSCDFSGLQVREADLRGAQLQGVNFADARFIRTSFTDTFGMVEAVATTSTGDRVAAGTASGDVRVWDTGDAIPIATWHEHEGSVSSVAFSADDQFLASASFDRTIRVWDLRTRRCVHVCEGHTDAVVGVACHPTAPLVASASYDKTVRIWSMLSGAELHRVSGHRNWIRAVAYGPAGEHIASCSLDGTVRVWNSTLGTCLAVLEDGPESYWSVAFAPSGQRVAAGGYDGLVRVWNWRIGELEGTLSGHDARVWSLVFPDDRTLMTASADSSIRTWSLDDGRVQQTFTGHDLDVKSVALAHARSQLISGSADQTVRFWNAESGRCDVTLQGHEQPIRAVAVNADGHLIASGGDDGDIRLWDADAGHCLRTLRGHQHWIQTLEFSPDGTRMVSVSDDRAVRTWDVESGHEIRVYHGHTGWIASASFSPDGAVIASGGTHRKIRLWDTETSGDIRVIDAYETAAGALAFTPDGSLLISGGHDHTDQIKLWDPTSGKLVATLGGQIGWIADIAVLHDGERFVSVGADALVHVWHLVDRAHVAAFEGHSAELRAVASHPDRSVVASAGRDRAIRVWDADSGSCLCVLRGHAQEVTSLAFRPHSEELVSSSTDGTIRVWDVARRVSVRTLVPDRPYEGMLIESARGLTEAQREALQTLGAVGLR